MQTHTRITQQDLIEAINKIPQERWQDILAFVESMQASRSPAKEPPIRTGLDLVNSPLIGIWRDRDDITDSRRFARELRKQAEHR